ncbi:MAG TPA: RNA polymerase sigma factor [Bryobacteraceae bacterium]|nr:RNA polymerase sigma factor [Bryobacteraceae bacterium]
MDLFERFAAGDLDAFETVFRQSQREVYGWIVRIVRDSAAAEDLTIETFWRIYRWRHRFDPTRPFGPWARRIATHAAIDHLRPAHPVVPLPLNIPAGRTEDPVWQREVRECVAGAFRTLPAQLEAAATLALIEECPYEEIAAALGISVGTVKSRIFRAVRMLRKKLERLGIHP